MGKTETDTGWVMVSGHCDDAIPVVGSVEALKRYAEKEEREQHKNTQAEPVDWGKTSWGWVGQGVLAWDIMRPELAE